MLFNILNYKTVLPQSKETIKNSPLREDNYNSTHTLLSNNKSIITESFNKKGVKKC